MLANRGEKRLFLCLLVCGLWGLWVSVPAFGAGVAIKNVEVDGRVQSLPGEPVAAGRDQKPLQVASTAQSLRFQFAAGDATELPAVRLRYKLEGYDEAWHELSPRMRVLVLFSAEGGGLVGSQEFYLEGETPHWRAELKDALFVPRQGQVVVPEGAAAAGIAFLSHGGEAGLGVMGIDVVRVLVQRPGAERADVFDLGLTGGTALDQPSGSPANWIRTGSRLELSELGIRATPAPHPILVIRDDDPNNYGNWSLASDRRIPVQPGDRLTVEWQTAHSIGGSGPGQADYGALKPGSYWFRVAAVKANGEPTGEEVSLPVEVRLPIYFRLECWLVASALVLGGTAWIGRVAVQRRMQRRIAEIEHEQALDKERARIARDLHDEIGAGLTEIAMQTDWVRRDLAGANLPDTRRRVESVCRSAVDLVRSVDEIVWAVNPANDTVERFVNYLAQSAEQFLEAAGLRVRFDIPEQLPVGTLTGVQRHIVFLAVREALNNAVKHAGSDMVRLEIRTDATVLRIAIADDGCGFDPEQAGLEGTHEGLANMRRRMEEIGGQFCLRSRPDDGTRVEFRVTFGAA
jgi:signal transduction histidine kinase